MALLIFENKHEFVLYVEKNKPTEIWCAEFSDEYPYLIIENYYKKSAKVNFAGYYNKQGVLISGKYEHLLPVWKESIYVKPII